MPEELRADNVSSAERNSPGFEAAMEQAARLERSEVIDANGRHVGRITKSFVEGGELTSCEMRVDGNIQSGLNIPDRTLQIPMDHIADVGEDSVRLDCTVEQVAGIKSEHHGHADGASGKPRKVR